VECKDQVVKYFKTNLKAKRCTNNKQRIPEELKKGFYVRQS